MSDLSKLNAHMNGYADAESFNMAANGEVHRVESGRVDPNLTHYVGSEAAKELRELFEDVFGELNEQYLTIQAEYRTQDYDPYPPDIETLASFRARLDHILGLLHQ